MLHLLLVDLALTMKQLLSLCTIPFLPTLLSGGDTQRNSTYGSTVDMGKQWVVVINGFIIRVNNFPPPPLFTQYNKPIVGFI